MEPFVSVLIPCRNEAASIERALTSVLAANYPPERMEVIAADGGSTDGTRATLERLAVGDARLRVLDNPERITPVGLNRAIAAAHGDYLVRVDAHSVIDPAYIGTLVRFLETHPDAWGAGGAMRTEPESASPSGWAIATVLAHRFGVGNSRFRTATASVPEPADTVFNCCWRRAAFTRVGLFHEALARSQDMEMSERIRRAGGTLWRVPDARTTYFARVGWRAYLRHNLQNGIWSLKPAIYLGRLPVGWRHLAPLVFVAALGITTLAALAVPGFGWLPLVPAAPYAFLNLVASIHTASSRQTPPWTNAVSPWRMAARLAAAFAGLHLAYGLGSMAGLAQLLASHCRPSQVRPAPAWPDRAAPVSTTDAAPATQGASRHGGSSLSAKHLRTKHLRAMHLITKHLITKQ